MMEVASSADLIRVLEQEAEALENMADDGAAMQMYLIERNWAGMEELLARIGERSEQIRGIEEQRIQIYREQCTALGVSVQQGLAGLLPRIALESERGALRGVQRRMRSAVLHIRSVVSGIERYVGAMVGTLHAIIDELYPNNRTYSHSGEHKAPKGRALVVDHSS